MLTAQTRSEKECFWEAHLGDWARSGLTQKSYCRHEGIKLHCFSYWRARLSKNPRPKSVAQAPHGKLRLVPINSPAIQTPSKQVAGSNLRLEFKDCQLVVPAHVDERLLRTVIDMLRRG